MEIFGKIISKMMFEMISSYYNKTINKGDVFMGKKIDRTGEEGYNKFGSKMVITKYRGNKDIDIYFPEYNWTFEHVVYNAFKNGNIKCPYEPRVFEHGYLGEGKYKMSENGKHTDKYDIWYGMLQRCYDPKFQERRPTYKGCKAEDYLLNFQHMGEWIDENYYEVSGEVMCLDKDILCKGNKIYSRETCIFVPERINILFTKRDKLRGKNPIGVDQLPSGDYRVRCGNGYGKSVYLGTYFTKEKAFNVYKEYKEKVIKEVIDSYEGIIPEPHYSRLKTAMYNYEVEIDD